MAEDPRNLPPTAPTKTSPTDPKIPTPAQPSGPPPPPSVKQPPPPPRVAKAPAQSPSSRAPTSLADAVGLQQEKKRRLAEQQLAEAAARGDENSELEWLTYETRCNSAEMVKGNKGLAYGLFALPFDDLVQIAALDDLPQVLVDAFFPGMTKDDILWSSRETTTW